ncbi:hypothetical protein GCM10028868_22810 [Virgibacillus kimchii]
MKIIITINVEGNELHTDDEDHNCINVEENELHIDGEDHNYNKCCAK